jgi:hypothetical protein
MGKSECNRDRKKCQAAGTMYCNFARTYLACNAVAIARKGAFLIEANDIYLEGCSNSVYFPDVSHD